MNRKDVLAKLSQLMGQLQRDYAVERVALFGSVARGENTPDSDLDIMVAFRGKTTYDKFTELKFFLEKVFNTKVDLVTEAGLDDRIRPYIKEDLIRVA